MTLQAPSPQLLRDVDDVENGALKIPLRRPLRLRSLAVRVLGVVAAAVACLVEGRPGMVLPFGIPSKERSSDRGMPTENGKLQRSAEFLRGSSGSISSISDDSEAKAYDALDTTDVATLPATPLLSRAFTIFWEVCVKSTLWMSASLASLIPFVQLTGGVSIDWRPFWAGFFESLIAYTLDHLRDMRRTTASTVRPKASSLIRMHVLKTLSFIGLFGFASSVAMAPIGRHFTVCLTFTLHLLLCVAYAKLKVYMPYMKALYVSFCVVFMAVAAPAAYDPDLLAGYSTAALFRLIMLILSVSFTIENLQDLRDIREDKEEGVVTLPSGLGAEWTRRILMASQSACIGLQFAFAAGGILPLRHEMLAVHLLCMLCALGFRDTTPRYLFQVILEPLYVSPIAMLVVRAVLTYS